MTDPRYPEQWSEVLALLDSAYRLLAPVTERPFQEAAMRAAVHARRTQAGRHCPGAPFSTTPWASRATIRPPVRGRRARWRKP
jgi:hypothetical protein